MSIFVQGIGWIAQSGYGCIRTGVHHPYLPEEARSLPKQDIFAHPFRNFGRLDKTSKMTVCAVALAMRDSDVDYAPGQKRDIGIIGTSREGSLSSDMDYFKDYIENGRTISRGNLFIYTLPSSPLGEAAIHFGFTGPLLYTTAKDHSLETVLDMAEEMIDGRETTMMLAGWSSEQEAIYFVLSGVPGGPFLCDFAKVRSCVKSEWDISTLKDRLSAVKNCTSGKVSREH
jgi:3-oxoacyl-[acyl-carrier-protein] synthase II